MITRRSFLQAFMALAASALDNAIIIPAPLIRTLPAAQPWAIPWQVAPNKKTAHIPLLRK